MQILLNILSQHHDLNNAVIIPMNIAIYNTQLRKLTIFERYHVVSKATEYEDHRKIRMIQIHKLKQLLDSIQNTVLNNFMNK